MGDLRGGVSTREEGTTGARSRRVGLGTAVGHRLGGLVEVFHNPALRRLQGAWGLFYAGEWTHFVALSVYAFDVGGATAVAVFGLVRLAPAIVALPFGALLADRYRRERVLLAIHLARAATLLAAAAALAADLPPAVVFALAALPPFAAAPLRPAQWALLPQLARTPRELVAANVSASTLEGLATLVGPAAAGVLLAVTGVETVVAASAGVYVWAALLVGRIAHESRPARRTEVGGRAALRETAAGFRVVATSPEPRLIVALFTAQTLVRGLLNVLLVAVALEFLLIGESGVGFLNAAFGAGGLLGALAAVTLTGRRRLGGYVALALVLWGAPIALLAGWPNAVWAFVCLALVGAGNSLLDVAGLTILQRTLDDAILARAFGALETAALAAVAVGSILAAPLVAALGVRWALVATGLLLPLLALISRRRLAAADERTAVAERELDVISGVQLFAPLPVTTLEKLAARLEPLSIAAGTEIVREGEAGEVFYVVAEGELDVSSSGHQLTTLGPGDHFGEIALLQDVPRTATVATRTACLLFALGRRPFLEAVTGHARSSASADEVVAERLARSSRR